MSNLLSTLSYKPFKFSLRNFLLCALFVGSFLLPPTFTIALLTIYHTASFSISISSNTLWIRWKASYLDLESFRPNGLVYCVQIINFHDLFLKIPVLWQWSLQRPGKADQIEIEHLRWDFKILNPSKTQTLA